MSGHRPAAINKQVCPGNQRRCGGSKKHNCPDNLSGMSDPPKGNVSKRLPMEVGICERGLGRVGPHKSRRDGVDRYAVWRPLQSKTARQMVDCGLAHAIDRLAMQGDSARLRADIDNASEFALDHGTRDGLGHKERAFEIDLQDKLEVFLVYVLGNIPGS